MNKPSTAKNQLLTSLPSSKGEILMTTAAAFDSVDNDSLRKNSGGIKPLPFLGSLVAFGAPALLMVFSYHVFMPRLIAAGLSAAESYAIAHIAPMAVLLAVSLHIFHNREGYPLSKDAFSRHFRYPRLTWRVALLGLGIFLVMNIFYGLFSQVGASLLKVVPPAGWIASVADVLDQSVQNRFEIIILYMLVLIMNVVGEELWWRGIILPRQELTHHRWTWVVHGLLWTAFHAFKFWDLIGLLPVCLVIAYVSQRTKNNWPALIAHGLFNGMALFLVVTAVLH